MPIIPPGTYSSSRRIHSAKPVGRIGAHEVPSMARPKSPVTMQTYLQTKLAEETRDKVNAQVEVDYLRGSVQWFSQRLSEILKGSNLPNTCLLDIVNLSTRLQGFADGNCRGYVPVTGRASNFNDLREIASRSEMKCLKLTREKEELEATLAKLQGNQSQDPMDGEVLAARLQIQQLNQDLARKRIESSSTISRYEEEIRKLANLHKDEVGGLRSTIASLTTSLDKWKEMYAKDIARLERQLHNKELESRTVKRTTT